MIRVSARDTFGVVWRYQAESIKTLDTTHFTCTFPSTDHDNCVDVSKCYLACLFRAQEVPKHVQGGSQQRDFTPRNNEKLLRFIRCWWCFK